MDEEMNTSVNSLPEGQVSDLGSSLKSQSSHDVNSSSATKSFHDIGSRLRAAVKCHRQRKGTGAGAARLRSDQRMSRKIRHSDPNISESYSGPDRKPLGYMQLRHLVPNKTSGSPSNLLTTKLLDVAQRDNFCDVEISGANGNTVKVPSFLLACHSTIFEEIFYPKGQSKGKSYSIVSQRDPLRLSIDFAYQATIEAVLHYCATLDLPSSLEENEPSESNIRILSQLHVFAQLFNICGLANTAYQTARRLMNRAPPLACASFDESYVILMRAEAESYWGIPMEEENYYNLSAYALDFLRESPMTTILGPKSGVVYLSYVSIEAIIRDQEIDADEYTMWRILNVWVSQSPGTNDEKFAKARNIASWIQLELIDPIQLNCQVKKCGYVDQEDLDEALKKITLMSESFEDEREQVVVEGAGDNRVNGIYFLANNDIGLKKDEVIFLKQGDEDGDLCSDFGLYCWGDKWSISNCTEYFNVLYSCEISLRKGHSARRPPKWGWKSVNGADSAPTCSWKPSKEDAEKVTDIKIAPALTKNKHEKNNLRESLTLDEMMSLPEDIDFSRDRHQYASLTKDFETMMNLSVYEGHDDEEGGYDVNYMSATLFCESSSNLISRTTKIE